VAHPAASLTEVGDRIAITVAAAPIAVACGVRAYRDIGQRREWTIMTWRMNLLSDIRRLAEKIAGMEQRCAPGRVSVS
jgi:hypothetical protein